MYADGQILFTHEQLFQSSKVKSEKIRLFEAFSGYGSQSLALEMLGVDFEHVGIAEIDKYAIQAHRALHGDVKNYGDISKIESEDIPDHELLTYSFPCPDISKAGKNKGLVKDSGTRSSLLWECEKIINVKRPRFLMMENVNNLVSKKYKPYFDQWLLLLESYGYNNYWKSINALDCGIPQNRNRVFVISILKEFDDGSFRFNEDVALELTLKDLLESEVSDKYYLSEGMLNGFEHKPSKKQDIKYLGYVNQDTQASKVFSQDKASPTLCAGTHGYANGYVAQSIDKIKDMTYKRPFIKIRKNFVSVKANIKKGFIICREFDSIDLERPKSTTRRARLGRKIVNTLTTSCNHAVILRNLFDLIVIRRLTPKECGRLMGLSVQKIDLIESLGLSDTQMYKLYGNSIVVHQMSFLKNLPGIKFKEE